MGHRVVEEDQQQLDEPCPVRPRRRRPWRVDLEPDVALGRQGARAANGLPGDLGHVDGRHAEHQSGLVPGRELQEVADQPSQAIGLRDDVVEQVAPFCSHQALTLEHFRVRPDQGRGRAQLVRCVRDEPALRLEAIADRGEGAVRQEERDRGGGEEAERPHDEDGDHEAPRLLVVEPQREAALNVAPERAVGRERGREQPHVAVRRRDGAQIGPGARCGDRRDVGQPRGSDAGPVEHDLARRVEDEQDGAGDRRGPLGRILLTLTGRELVAERRGFGLDGGPEGAVDVGVQR